MFAFAIFSVAIGVFFVSWICHHGLPMMGLHVDIEDGLLLSEVIGEDVLEA
ncbi:hypothetical protein VII00023_09721 [Vibrio ichthyoenteri ATCC 700023]|uniref:Uncharacterized protein n=1 Tax=Vibrio ichthyoenteri ATCC 700023 TaxID=870968 RepID=F9RZ61_9VIBR|nr:hypothetical protein [Vibrio ichthyoenteri]EGU46137.1 hypothetical protein VII00023_09721 [Vibrio ichthyoenteri ATCC 700023]